MNNKWEEEMEMQDGWGKLAVARAERLVGKSIESASPCSRVAMGCWALSFALLAYPMAVCIPGEAPPFRGESAASFQRGPRRQPREGKSKVKNRACFLGCTTMATAASAALAEEEGISSSSSQS